LKFEILDLFEEIMNFDCQFNLHSSSHWMNIWTLVSIYLSRKVSRP
jgi:hypothetical protein